jgi:cation diffusion facilitator family transporter
MSGEHTHEDHGHDHGDDGHDHHDHPHDDDHSHDHEDHDHSHEDHDNEQRGGLVGLVMSVVRPHSHEMTGHVEETSEVGIRALKVSLAGLGVTAVLQTVIVAMSGSVALLADTVHNFADTSTAVPLWLAFVVGRRAPTRRYTYGYGRAEDLAGIFIVATITLSAAVAGWQAVERLLNPQDIDDLALVAAAGAVGFVGNELAALHRIRVGRRIGSAALVADGLHARTDGLTSLAVVVGAAGVALGFPQADPLVGLVITVMILRVLRGAARDIYRRLMDSVDPDLVERVEHTLEHVDGVETVDSVRLRWIGHRLHAEAEIVSAPDLSLARAHEIAEEARHELLHAVPRLGQAIIHTSPRDDHERDPHALVAHHHTLPAPTSRRQRDGMTVTRSGSRSRRKNGAKATPLSG